MEPIKKSPDSELKVVPEINEGDVELTDDELEAVSGGEGGGGWSDPPPPPEEPPEDHQWWLFS